LEPFEHQRTVKSGCFRTQQHFPELKSLNTVDRIVREFHNTASLSGTGILNTVDRMVRVLQHSIPIRDWNP
jgi:hypothetical protein